MTSGGPPPRVGPVLVAGRAADAVIAAIQELDSEATVIARGSYVRVTSPRLCAVTRAAIEAHLGGPFRLPQDLEAIMPAFAGRFSVSHDRAEWRLGNG